MMRSSSKWRVSLSANKGSISMPNKSLMQVTQIGTEPTRITQQKTIPKMPPTVNPPIPKLKPATNPWAIPTPPHNPPTTPHPPTNPSSHPVPSTKPNNNLNPFWPWTRPRNTTSECPSSSYRSCRYPRNSLSWWIRSFRHDMLRRIRERLLGSSWRGIGLGSRRSWVLCWGLCRNCRGRIMCSIFVIKSCLRLCVSLILIFRRLGINY